jgi:hypothetical protein
MIVKVGNIVIVAIAEEEEKKQETNLIFGIWYKSNAGNNSTRSRTGKICFTMFLHNKLSLTSRRLQQRYTALFFYSQMNCW